MVNEIISLFFKKTEKCVSVSAGFLSARVLVGICLFVEVVYLFIKNRNW